MSRFEANLKRTVRAFSLSKGRAAQILTQLRHFAGSGRTSFFQRHAENIRLTRTQLKAKQNAAFLRRFAVYLSTD